MCGQTIPCFHVRNVLNCTETYIPIFDRLFFRFVLKKRSSFSEQTYRNHFEKKFDFLAFNKHLINQVSSAERAVALDPSYIPKAGKSTYGRGRYWSGVAKAAKWGLDICGFAVVDIVNNTALHLNAWQTPPAAELIGKGEPIDLLRKPCDREWRKVQGIFRLHHSRCVFLQEAIC